MVRGLGSMVKSSGSKADNRGLGFEGLWCKVKVKNLG